MMKDYNEQMSCSREEYDNLNELVDNINKHLGEEVFALESTKDYETECVDIWECGEINSNYLSFEDATTYLEGVQNGVLLKESYSV